MSLPLFVIVPSIPTLCLGSLLLRSQSWRTHRSTHHCLDSKSYEIPSKIIPKSIQKFQIFKRMQNIQYIQKLQVWDIIEPRAGPRGPRVGPGPGPWAEKHIDFLLVSLGFPCGGCSAVPFWFLCGSVPVPLRFPSTSSIFPLGDFLRVSQLSPGGRRTKRAPFAAALKRNIKYATK